MNAGRDVERLIADWLVEEVPGRAPDRILDAAARAIDRTKQRRFAVAWREPMIISTARLVAAVFVIAAVVGAGLIGRSTASVGGPGDSAPGRAQPSQSASIATLATYAAARAVVCRRYAVQADPLKSQLTGIFSPELTPDQRAPKVDALDQIRSITVAQIADLRTLDAPGDMSADHAVSIARMEDNLSLIEEVLKLVRINDLVGARAVDLSTDPISRQIEAFERKYFLDPCP